MAAEETLKLIIQTELQNAIGELTALKDGILELGKKTRETGQEAQGLSEFEKAFGRFKEEAARAKIIQEDFNKALAATPDDEQLKEFGRSMGAFGEKAKDATQVVGELVSALGLVAASRAALEFAKESAAAWGEQEAGVKRLNAALTSQGRLTESLELQQFAGDLQKATGQGDELTLSLMGNFAALGRTTPELRNMARAASELAAGTGMSLPQAMEALNLSLDGQVRGLSMTVPAVRNLTEEQLRNGEAIRLVSSLYQGQAAAAMNTLNGKIAALNGEWGDMQESLFEEFAPMVKDIVDGVRSLVAGVTELPEPVKVFAAALVALTAAGVGTIGALTAFNAIKPAIMASLAQMAGGATTFWGAMMGPVGWAALIIAGLAAVTTAIVLTTNEARRASEEFQKGIAEAGSDLGAKLRLTNQEVARLEAQIKRIEEGPNMGRYRAANERRLADLREELRITQALAAEYRAMQASATSRAQTDAVLEAARRNRSEFEENGRQRLDFLDQFKSDLQRRRDELDRLQLVINDTIRDQGRTGLYAAERQALQSQLDQLVALRTRLRNELAQASSDLEKTPFERAFEAYQQGMVELSNRSRNLNLSDLEFESELRQLSQQFVEATAMLGNMTAEQKAQFDAIATFAIEPKIDISPFQEGFEAWKKQNDEAARAEREWRSLLEETVDLGIYAQLVEYGQAMGYFKEEIDQAAEGYKNLHAGMTGAFGDLGGPAAGILSAFLNEDDQAELTKHLDKMKGAYKATFGAVADLAKEFSASMDLMGIQALQAEIERLEESLAAHDRTTDKQLEARERLGQDTVDFELRAAVDRERIEKDLARKQAELKFKEFRMNQAIRAGEAAINTATSATVPGVLGTPLMAVVIGAGLLQQGLIWGQQAPEVPAFYDGSIVSGSASGILARIGERNQSEMVLPLRPEKLKELGISGSGGDITIGSMYFTQAMDDPQAAAKALVEELRRMSRSGDLNLSELTL